MSTIDSSPIAMYLKTTNDVKDFHNTLEQLAQGLYRTDNSAEEALRNALPYEQAVLIRKLAGQNGISMDDKEKVQQFFNDLMASVQRLPVVQVTLATRPKAQLIIRMHEWFYLTFHKQVILDVVIKPEIIAGSIISYNGKYFDYSLSKRTEQV